MISNIIQSVVDVINLGSYSEPLTAVQRWAPEIEKGEAGTVCYVWCSGFSLSRDNRCGTSTVEADVKVGIRKPVSTGSVPEVNEVADLSESIADQILSSNLGDIVAANAVDWVSPIELDELYEDAVAISIFEIKLRGIN
jgi:hypothetical protein